MRRMGYDTTFTGRFELDKPLSEAQAAYLRAFANTRRVERNEAIAVTLADPLREAVGLPIGAWGAYFVGADGFMGQQYDKSITDNNSPPPDQPGLWCQWVPSHNRMSLEWDENEKFYDAPQWVKYLIDHFLKPWGFTVSGIVEWQGEKSDDAGQIVVLNNVVHTAKYSRIFGRFGFVVGMQRPSHSPTSCAREIVTPGR
jgi:hypothetical protein